MVIDTRTIQIIVNSEPVSYTHLDVYKRQCNDRVIFFCCGGGLNKWERGENAWTEHARHFPVCSYVMLVKDKKFILKALGIITEPEAAAGAAATAVAVENGQSTDSIKENKIKEEGGPDRDTMCKVCYAHIVEVVLLPYRHFVTCVNCAITLNTVSYTHLDVYKRQCI